jgi:hypothetical protein
VQEQDAGAGAGAGSRCRCRKQVQEQEGQKPRSDEADRGFRKVGYWQGLTGRLPREWNSSPPIVAIISVTVSASVVVVVAVATAVIKSIDIADVS